MASRGVAIGAHAEGILAVDFEQIGGFVEKAGDGFVVHEKGVRCFGGQALRLAPTQYKVKDTPNHQGQLYGFTTCFNVPDDSALWKASPG